MDKETEAKQQLSKPPKRKIFRNISLVSILVVVVSFIVLFGVNLLTGKVHNDFIANVFIFIVVLSAIVGGMSFLIWTFSLINKRAIEKPNKEKIFRNIWFICIAIFVISLVGMFISATTDKSGSYVGVSVFTLILAITVVVGCISFLIWIFKLINKRLEEKPNRYISVFLKVVGTLVKIVLIFVGILLLLRIFVLQVTKIYGTSMEPKFKDGDYIAIEKLSYYLHDPKREDVVVYRSILPGSDDSIRRVVGLPNETLIIQKGQVEVNGSPLEEHYADWSGWEGKEPTTFKLGGDEYFVLLDKRALVPTALSVVKREQFTGRVFYRYWPSNEAGFISP